MPVFVNLQICNWYTENESECVCIRDRERMKNWFRKAWNDARNIGNIVEIKTGMIQRERKQRLFNTIMQESFLSEFWVHYLQKECWCVCVCEFSGVWLCNNINNSPPCSSVRGIFQETVLEWVAISSSRGSSRLGAWTCVFWIAGEFFTTAPPGKPHWRNTMICCCSVTKLCPVLSNPMGCSMPGFPVLHYLLEFDQIHVHWVSDAI